MEKCPKKTLARTLTCGARCAKVVLAAALFAPAFFASVQISEKTRPVTASDVKGVEVLEKPRPKELVKIYSIVKSHRPDIADSEIWNVSEVILEESSKRTLALVGAGADSNRKRLSVYAGIAEWRARNHADHARNG
jgi:hypothetical protein